MRSIEKNRKQRFTYLPISIKLVAKIMFIARGFSICGTRFVWTLAGLYILYPILRAVLSLLVGLLAIILFIFIMLTFL